MDKWFFIEVQTYQSVNKMGLELGHYVEEMYDHTVVHKDCIPVIYQRRKSWRRDTPGAGRSSTKRGNIRTGGRRRFLRFLLSLTALITTITYLSSEQVQFAR